MTKLLCAGFARLKKDRIFWIAVAAMVFIGLFVPVKNHMDGITVVFDKYIFGNALFTGVIAAVFSSLFIGTEYSDGAIRNKIVVGHTRNAIYLSNLIVNLVAALFIQLAFLIPICAVGIPLAGLPVMEAAGIVIFCLCNVGMIAAYCAIFTLLSMLIQNKALVAVVSLLTALALLILGSYMQMRLDAPEYYEGVSFVSTDGGTMMSIGEEGSDEMYPNPMYLKGNERNIYQFVYDFLPGGQALQIYMLSIINPWQVMLYSLVIVVLTTGCGLWFFRKKDIQ